MNKKKREKEEKREETNKIEKESDGPEMLVQDREHEAEGGKVRAFYGKGNGVEAGVVAPPSVPLALHKYLP